MTFHVSCVDEVLTTTRSVRRRLDLDRAVPDAVLAECIDIATQAPSGGNTQTWRWMVVRDPEKRRTIGQLYSEVFDDYIAAATKVLGEERTRQSYGDPGTKLLAERLGDVPVHIIPCSFGRPEQLAASLAAADPELGITANFAASSFYASVWPAAWSLMLALRARGLGSSITTLHLLAEQRSAEILGIPDHVTQLGLLPVAYYTGTTFGAGLRRPATEVTYWDTWGTSALEPAVPAGPGTSHGPGTSGSS